MLDAIRSEDMRLSEQAITNFKQFIKRNLVDLNMILPYISALISVYHVRELSVLSFSTLCHLIKRVSFQNPAVLQTVYDPILPFLLQRLSEHKDSIRITSMKSLKTCIECAPNGDIDAIIYYLIKDGLMSNQSRVQSAVLDLLYQIMESASSFNFSFKQILDNTVPLLTIHDDATVSKSNQLLIYYFTSVNPTNNTAKSDLVNALLNENVPYETASMLLNSIDQKLYEQYINFVNPPQPTTQAESTSTSPSLNNREKLDEILAKIPNWNTDDSAVTADESTPESDPGYDGLYNEYEPHFEAKETEKNWKHRQLYIIKLRQILRGKKVLLNVANFVNLLSNTKEWIMKGMVSLRTTLSNNSCQLCKELGIYLGSFLDNSFIEYLLSHLLKLTAGRKVIQHQNSNVAIIALLLYTNFNNKIFNLLSAASQDKNIQPRAYTAKWIQLLVLKFYDTNHMDLFYSFVDAVESIIVKGLSDPIPMVKDSMRSTFWTVCELEPSYESRIIKKLDVPIVKALERSKGSYVSNFAQRIPIKELIKEQFALKPNSSLNIQKQQTSPETHQKLSYEPIRKTVRSESLDLDRINEKKYKPAVRHHTIGTERIIQGQSHISEHESSQKAQYLHNTMNANNNARDDEYDDFTDRIKRENVIYEEITSDSSDTQRAGLLKLLKENDATITVKFHSALNQLTIINPQIFELLFTEGNESAFVKISNYISTENTVRIFCLYLINTNNFDRIELIVRNLPLEDLCLSITKLLNFAIDTSKLDNIILSIQFIKNRYAIITSILEIFNTMLLLKKDEIKSYLLSSIFESLFASFKIIKIDEEIKKKYLKTFSLCQDEFHGMFMHTLNNLEDVSLKDEIYTLLGFEIAPVQTHSDHDDVSMTEEIPDNHIDVRLQESELEEEKAPPQSQSDIRGEEIRRESQVNDHDQKSDEVSNIDHRHEMSIADDVSEMSDIRAYELDEVSTVKIEEILPNKKNTTEKAESEGTASSAGDTTQEQYPQSLLNHQQEMEGNSTVLIVEEGTDISMHQTEPEAPLTVSILEEVAEMVTPDPGAVETNSQTQDISSHNVTVEPAVKTVEGCDEDKDELTDVAPVKEQQPSTDILEEPDKVMSDSTPDLHMLTIDETETVDGYLGAILDVLSEENVEIDDLSVEDLQLQSIDDFRRLYRMLKVRGVDQTPAYNKLIESARTGTFVVESLALMRYIGIVADELELLQFFNTLVGDTADERFIAIYENVRLISLKKLLAIDKMKNYPLRMQEIILRCIYEILNGYAQAIDGEDVFMIETFVKRTVSNDDTFIRMYSYDIYRELYQIHYRGEVDAHGIELVDKVMFEGIDEKLMKYCEV